MKQSLGLSGVKAIAVALGFLFSSAALIHAQTASATPDAFVAQITNVTTSGRNAFATGISGDGRFVVIESTANLAPSDPNNPNTAAVNNADGNREIFLFDYVQRKIFQITNTRNALVDPTKPPVDPATPNNFSNIAVEVSNNRAVISFDGKWVVFSSNAYVDSNAAATPKSFNGSDFRDALRTDGNQEVFLYRIPDVPAVDLSSGSEVSPVDLTGGMMTRVTNTTNAVKPLPGTATQAPTAVDDNRSATLNDDGSVIAFVSSRNITGANADLNAEIVLYNRSNGTFTQATTTANPANTSISLIWNTNPWLSGDGTRMSFISSADEQIPNAGANEADTAKGNGEVYFANLSGTNVSSFTRVTRTQPIAGDSTTVLSPGARISRNGGAILFETKADIQTNGSVSGNPLPVAAIYLFSVGDSSFKRITERPTLNTTADLANLDITLRFPTFSGDSSTVVYASNLNFLTSGQISTSTTEGLNPSRRVQIFAVPVAGAITVTRLTNTPTGTASTTGLQPLVSNTVRRIAFSYTGAELGGGNSDFSPEAFYLLAPGATSETTTAAISYATGATNRPVAAPSPSPTPTGDFAPGLAPGMLGIARTTAVSLAPSEKEVDRNNAQENQRRPPLPIELNGVSVALNGAAAGLYFVAPGQLNFVVPPGLPAGTYNVVINNNGAVIRSTLAIAAAQPDIATTTNGAGGRAMVLNVTNPCVPTAEPFTVTTTRPTGGVCSSATTETVATELLIMLTGVRTVQRANVTVRIGTTDLTGDAIVSVGPSNTAGFDQIVVRLPATLAAAGDVPVIVTVGGASSRPADAAPRITIN